MRVVSVMTRSDSIRKRRYYFTAWPPPRQRREVLRSACLSVRPSARIYLKNHIRPNFTTWLGPPLTAVQFVVRARIKGDAYVSSGLPGGVTGGELCHLRLRLVSIVIGLRVVCINVTE